MCTHARAPTRLPAPIVHGPRRRSGYQALMQGSGHCEAAGASGYNDATFRASMEILQARTRRTQGDVG